MNTFCTSVDLRSRVAMTEFLSSHGRYFTMHSVNGATSYANCVKVHRLGLTPAQLEQAWKMLDMPVVFHAIRDGLERWAEARRWEWQIGQNGRSSGYLVLYRGGLDYEHARTAQCDECGKLTYHTQDVPCTGEGCDGTLRVLEKPVPQVITWPGKGVDEHEDWSEWSMGDLRERVRLVQDFDRTCDEAVATFVRFCDAYRVVEKTVSVPTQVRVLETA
jgi:hypothetical protein